MSASIDLLYELKQVRYGISLDEVIKREKIETGKVMTLKLPLDRMKKKSSPLVDFCLMALVTAVMESLFILLAYYLFV